MEKIEKYKSFDELKSSTKAIDSTNAAVVMERHHKMKDFIEFLRVEHTKNHPTMGEKPVSQS